VVLKNWMRENDAQPGSPLFPTRAGQHLTRGAIWRLVTKHASTATDSCPSLAAKHVTPHVLRHSAAMTLLHSGVDISVIALWLGHEGLESTNIYIHADMALKERALARVKPPTTGNGRYRAADDLLAFLEHL
jgi:site-specific recombinase XerD